MMKRVGSGTFSAVVALRPDWFILAIPSGVDMRTAADEVANEIALMGDVAALVSEPKTSGELAEIAKAAGGKVVIFTNLDRFTVADWAELDYLRGAGLQGRRVLIVKPETVNAIVNAAPNLASWLEGSIWILDPEAQTLKGENLEKRLASLRSHYKMTDNEVLERAKKGNLPEGPDFVEWLVLLDRGDLIERG
jgi:hypothetical protein